MLRWLTIVYVTPVGTLIWKEYGQQTGLANDSMFIIPQYWIYTTGLDSDELPISIITSTFQSDPYLISAFTSALTLLTLETSCTRRCSLVSNLEKEISLAGLFPEQQR